MRPAVTVIGVPERGCAGIPDEAARAVASSHVLAGEASLLAFFPQFAGIKTDLSGIEQLSLEHTVSVLLSSGPSFSLESQRIAARVGCSHVRVL